MSMYLSININFCSCYCTTNKIHVTCWPTKETIQASKFVNHVNCNKSKGLIVLDPQWIHI